MFIIALEPVPRGHSLTVAAVEIAMNDEQLFEGKKSGPAEIPGSIQDPALRKGVLCKIGNDEHAALPIVANSPV